MTRKIFTETVEIRKGREVVATFRVPITIEASVARGGEGADISLKYPQAAVDRFVEFARTLGLELGGVEIRTAK